MRFNRMIIAGFISLALTPAVLGDVKLARFVGDHMVLQRNAKCTIWGTASPDEKITVVFAGNTVQTSASPDGKWSCQLPPMEANVAPQEMTVTGNNVITVKNILVGDVWFCAGQSNMGWQLAWSENGAEEAAKADHPALRFFPCQGSKADVPQDDVKHYQWTQCNPKSANTFSAVAYYFGKKLNADLKVPIGLIGAGYGGTAIEQWMAEETYKTDPTLAGFAAIFAAKEAAFPKLKEEWDKKQAQWEAKKAEILATNPAAKPGAGIPYGPNPIYPPSDFNYKLYNSTVSPLRNVSVAGFIWYQGESNVGDAPGYAKQFPAMIRHWRKHIGHGEGGDLPFLFVQIADGATTGTADQPNRLNGMSELRASQLTALALPKTAMVVTLDVCEANNAHPKYKEPVGSRLAIAALAVKYGKEIPNYSSPLMESMKSDGGNLVLKFKFADGGLVSKENQNTPKNAKLTGFAVAGADGKFFLADAKIDNDTITVSSSDVKAPVSVRYAWGLVPAYTIWNKADLPLGTFQAGEIGK
ncbi:MAG: sialate O-acetylesterase [Phycisphaerales bacterium]|nr:sialate O-acetylesterase [Phycisphaerales bacterium]